MVDTESAGVPHGGRFGHVDWFEQEAAKHGLRIGWSRLKRCFGIFTTHGRKHVFQFLCQRRRGDPIPLNSDLLRLMLCARRDHRSTRGPTIAARVRQMAVDAEQIRAREHRKQIEAAMPDAVDWAIHRRGGGRILVAMPGRDF